MSRSITCKVWKIFYKRKESELIYKASGFGNYWKIQSSVGPTRQRPCAFRPRTPSSIKQLLVLSLPCHTASHPRQTIANRPSPHVARQPYPPRGPRGEAPSYFASSSRHHCSCRSLPPTILLTVTAIIHVSPLLYESSKMTASTSSTHGTPFEPKPPFVMPGSLW
jgi:hypothetical protein